MTDQHARVEKLIINLDTGMPNMCSWHDCEKYSRTPYQIRIHEHARSIRCSSIYARHYHYAFCSDGCRDLWINCTGGNALASIDRTGRAFGNHSAGMRGGIR